jgi:hypothetical protein
MIVDSYFIYRISIQFILLVFIFILSPLVWSVTFVQHFVVESGILVTFLFFIIVLFPYKSVGFLITARQISFSFYFPSCRNFSLCAVHTVGIVAKA